MPEESKTNAELGAPRGEPIVLKVKRSPWPWAMPLLGGLLLLVVGVIGLLAQRGWLWPAVALIGLALAAFGVVLAIRQSRRRDSIAPYDQGVIVTLPPRRLVLPYARIQGLALSRETVLNNGVPEARKLRLRIWKSNDFAKPPLCDLTTEVKFDSPELERLADLLEHMIQVHADQLGAQLERGEPVVGENFTLRQGVLRVAQTELAVDDISKAGLWEGRLCFWRRDEPMPLIALPETAANALPMLHLVQRQLEARGPAAEERPVSGLGRVLFERKMSRAGALGTVVFGAVALIVGLAILAIAGPGAWIAILIGVLLGLLCIFGGLHGLRARFRCHEAGVYHRGLFKERALRYDEMAAFTYSAVRNYVNGVYSGTSVALQFEPQAGRNAEKITYSTSVRGMDEALDDLRDHIAGVIGRRMVEQLERGEETAWAGTVTLAPEGLRYRPAKLLGKGEETTLPWEEVEGVNFHEGTLHIWAKGREKSVIQLSTGAHNFWPGFFAFIDRLPAAEAAEAREELESKDEPEPSEASDAAD